MVADPDQLGRREARQGVVAGQLDEPLGPDGGPDAVALGAGALIVPEDGRPEHRTRLVEDDEAVHLAGQADGDDRLARRAGARQDIADGGDRAVPPELRVLLAPQRGRDVVAVLGDADAANDAGAVDQDRLGRGRRDVDADDEARSGHRRRRVSGGRTSDRLAAVDGPDVLVDEALQHLLATGDRPRVDLAGRHAVGERLQARLTAQDRACRGARPSRL